MNRLYASKDSFFTTTPLFEKFLYISLLKSIQTYFSFFPKTEK